MEPRRRFGSMGEILAAVRDTLDVDERAALAARLKVTPAQLTTAREILEYVSTVLVVAPTEQNFTSLETCVRHMRGTAGLVPYDRQGARVVACLRVIAANLDETDWPFDAEAVRGQLARIEPAFAHLTDKQIGAAHVWRTSRRDRSDVGMLARLSIHVGAFRVANSAKAATKKLDQAVRNEASRVP